VLSSEAQKLRERANQETEARFRALQVTAHIKKVVERQANLIHDMALHQETCVDDLEEAKADLEEAKACVLEREADNGALQSRVDVLSSEAQKLRERVNQAQQDVKVARKEPRKSRGI